MTNCCANCQGLGLDIIHHFATQLLVSINFLHSLGIMHCDLKPQNILLKQEDQLDIKVIDFGSSCFQQHQQYVITGSLGYAAPEIILEDFPYSTAIDMWSLGCTLAELYIGHPLFTGWYVDCELISLF